MQGDGVSETVARFLADEIASVRELEVLLSLRASGAAITAHKLANELRSGARWTEQQLDRLALGGIVSTTTDDSGQRVYRYAPNSAELATVIDDTAQLFATRRATVIGLIFAEIRPVED